jgi:hypothetical protein
MTTPAVLYHHVPIKDNDYDDDTIKEDSSPSCRSTCSYPVSSMVHQVSAPVELTVKDDCALIRNRMMMKMVKKKILPVMRRRMQR